MLLICVGYIWNIVNSSNFLERIWKQLSLQSSFRLKMLLENSLLFKVDEILLIFNFTYKRSKVK